MKTSLLVLLFAAAAHASEGDMNGGPELPDPRQALRQELPPVSGDVAFKGGRLELAPMAAFSFRDAYYRKYVVGLEAAWHLTDWFSVGGFGGYSFTREARAVHLCDADSCAAPDPATLAQRTPGNLTFLSGLEVQLAPFYGKLSFLAETFGNFDIHVRLGAALVGYQNPGLRLSPGGKVGIGARYFLTRWLALRADVDDVIYPEVVTKNGVESNIIRNQLFFQVGVAVFLGGGQ